MKVHLLFAGRWDHDLHGVYANKESADKALAELSPLAEPSIEEWEAEDLINKEAQ